MIEGMVIDMNDKQLATLTQLRLFLEGTATVDLQLTAAERYAFIGRTLQRFGYRRLPRADKGVLLRFLERVSGYSRQQLTRLVKRGSGQTPLSKRYSASRTSFARTYTSADVRLLAETDNLHSTLSGLATKKLMERACLVFGDVRYERLATISVAHLYNLRQRLTISGYGRCGPRRGRSRWPLANGARQHPTISLDTCAWTACIKAIATASKAFTTSIALTV